MQSTKLYHSARFVILFVLALFLLASCAVRPEGSATQVPLSPTGKTTGAGAESAGQVAARDSSSQLTSGRADGSTGEVVDDKAPATDAAVPPDGPTLLQENCTRCHAISFFDEVKKTRSEWEWALKMMSVMGVRLEDSEKEILINYLAEKPIE